ncbi:MAG: RND family transporter [Sandaracinaceae bacterium]
MGGLLELALHHRRAVLLVLGTLTLGLVAGIPRLRAVFAPEELVPPVADQRERARTILGGFPDRGEPLLVLLQADDVLERPVLGALHALGRGLEAQDWVAEVDGLTTIPLPRSTPQPDQGQGETLEDLDDLGDGPDLEESPESEDEELLGRLVATDPQRFPLGLLSVSQRGGAPTTTGPLVEGDEVTDAEAAALREAVERVPRLSGRLVSPDRRLAVLAVHPAPDIEDDALEAKVRATRGWLAAQDLPPGVTARLGGLPEVRASMVDALLEDQVWLISLALLGSLAMLLLSFRTFAGVALPLGAAGMTAGMVVGAMGWLGEPINLLNNVVPALLITIGLGDAVHLLVRHREELDRDGDREAATRRCMRAMANACFLTSATTAVGFGSLMVSHTEVLRRFGFLAAAGVMLAYVVTVLFLPAALPGLQVRTRAHGGTGAVDRALSRLAAAVARRPVAAVLVSLGLLLGSVAYGRQVEVDSALIDQIDRGSPSRQTVALLETSLDGIRRVDVGMEGPPGSFDRGAGLRALERVETRLADNAIVLGVDGPVELLRALYAQVAADREAGASALATGDRAGALAELAQRKAPELWAQHVSEDGSRARLQVSLRDAGEGRIHTLLERLEGELEVLPYDTVISGEAARTSRGLATLVGDLTTSFALAVVVIFVMLGLVLRSIRLGLLSVLPNVLPLAVTIAYMAWRGIPLHAATAIVFTVSLGLCVDGTIHLLVRYREEIAMGRRRTSAVVRAVRGTGRAVLVGACTLLLGFVALLFASFVPVRWFAELSIVAIGSALAAEILVLPALLVLWGPRTLFDARRWVPGAREGAVAGSSERS